MDKTWRSRVFGQGRTRSGGPRLCADRSGAKNSTPFCGGGGYTVDWTLEWRKGMRKSIGDEQVQNTRYTCHTILNSVK